MTLVFLDALITATTTAGVVSMLLSGPRHMNGVWLDHDSGNGLHNRPLPSRRPKIKAAGSSQFSPFSMETIEIGMIRVSV
jgi:hypothetical protein